MIKAIQKLDNHIIVCGAGRVGSSVSKVLRAEKVPYVMIDQDEEIINHIEANGQLAILGDATEDEILERAGIARARGIVCALSEDAYNVFVVLTAKAKNPGLKIVARAERPETISKMQRAGADKVIAPAQISGHQMAMAMIKPVSVDLVDTLFTSKNLQLQLEEILVTEKSSLANRAIRDSFDREKNNIIVVTIIRNEDAILNPRGGDFILPGDTIVVIGSRSALEEVEGTAIR